MSFYRYKPLNSAEQEIRLVTIRKPEQGSIRPLRCSLQEVSLNDIEDTFVAASHVWGNDHHTFEVEIDGEPFLVTPQLWQFLYLVAQRIPQHRLWIDTICIDQANMSEKATQIPLMAKVYSSAKQTISFLHSVVDSHDSTLDIIHSNFTKGHRGSTLALIRPLLHEYWSRIWVVQELRLSKEREFWWEGLIIREDELTGIASAMRVLVDGNASNLCSALWNRTVGVGAALNMRRWSASLLDHMNLKEAGSDYAFAVVTPPR